MVNAEGLAMFRFHLGSRIPKPVGPGYVLLRAAQMHETGAQQQHHSDWGVHYIDCLQNVSERPPLTVGWICAAFFLEHQVPKFEIFILPFSLRTCILTASSLLNSVGPHRFGKRIER